jgi:NIMA (never in mitosis gene a)-related kinase 1/4/5
MQELGVFVVSELGRGTSGIVYKVQSRLDGSYKVIKTVNLSALSYSKQNQAKKEVEILKKLNHPHIIKYYNSLIVDGVLYILMEHASGGDLQTFITNCKLKHQHLTENQIWAWTYEICLAVHHLHSHKILHRDLKCLNIFLDSKSRIKIGDLGLSEILQDDCIENTAIGTPLFMSPEQIRRQPYGFKVDIWGIGCIIYTLCNLDAPFIGDNLFTLGRNITTTNPKPLPPKYSPSLQGLVSILLEKEHTLRPKIKEVIRMIPTNTKNRYKKPSESIEFIEKSQKIAKLPTLSSTKDSPIKIRDNYKILGTSVRKFSTKETPELPRTISRNLDKSRSRTTVNDLYNVI